MEPIDEVLITLWELSSPQMRQAAIYATMLKRCIKLVKTIEENQNMKSPG